MKIRIKYLVRGDWTFVDVTRLDVPDGEPDITHVIQPNGGTEQVAVRGRAVFPTYEWNLLCGKLGFRGPVGRGGERVITVESTDSHVPPHQL
jgi:hypothetical protein